MSAVFIADSFGEKFQVEITREGQMIFLDHDIEYDIAMAEFGEPESHAVTLRNQWIENPCDIMALDLDVERPYLLLLAADWIERTVETFKKNRSAETVTSLKQAIDAIKKFATGKIGKARLMKLTTATRKHGSSAMVAANNAVKAALSDNVVDFSLALQGVAFTAPLEFIHHDPKPQSHKEVVEIQRKEAAWQIRRFVDCMEAVQAGKRWPPLGATK